MMAREKRFIPLECNPAVFTGLINELGVPNLEFQDIYSIDEPDLLALVKRPVHSLIFIYPGDSSDELKEKRRLEKEGGVNGAPGSDGGDADSDSDEGDLFGDDNSMDIG